jgi:hypothetical protein
MLRVVFCFLGAHIGPVTREFELKLLTSVTFEQLWLLAALLKHFQRHTRDRRVVLSHTKT